MQHNIPGLTRAGQLTVLDQLISQIEGSNRGRNIRNYDYSNIDKGLYESVKFSGKVPIFSEIQARIYELHENYAKSCILYQKAAEIALDVLNDPKRAQLLLSLAQTSYDMSTNSQFDRIDANREKIWTDIVCLGKDIKSTLAKRALRK